MFLKDSLNIYRNHSMLDIRCLSCRNRKHLLTECPLLFYKPKRKVIVNNYHAEIEKAYKEAQKNLTRMDHRFQVLKNLKDLQSISLEYQKQMHQTELNRILGQSFDSDQSLSLSHNFESFLFNDTMVHRDD